MAPSPLDSGAARDVRRALKNSAARGSAAERCAWQAIASSAWITITSTNVGVGDGAVTYSVASNPGGPGFAFVSLYTVWAAKALSPLAERYSR